MAGNRADAPRATAAYNALVVQRTGRKIADLVIEVRFLARAHDSETRPSGSREYKLGLVKHERKARVLSVFNIGRKNDSNVHKSLLFLCVIMAGMSERTIMTRMIGKR